MRSAVIFIAGVLFAVGLGVSGMTQPHKIIGFLDLLGSWDPSLLFVMVGAVAIHSIAYITLNKQKGPVFESSYSLPNSEKISKKLIIGSLLFGVGWGLSGFCPGPGVVSLFSGNIASISFVISMLIGMFAFRQMGKGEKADG